MNPIPAATHAVSIVVGQTDCDSFAPNYHGPPVPVLAAVASGPLHKFGMSGRWDLQKAAAENADALLRSVRLDQADSKETMWDDLIFQLGPRSFVFADRDRLHGYAGTAAEAEAIARKFAEQYALPPDPEGGSYSMIRVDREIGRVTVPLPAESILSEETFLLHYGETAVAWHQDFVKRLTSRKSGLAILEGPPGTGKTSYLRHLMGVLRQSHRFYFIPASTLGVLSDPNFIGFWADQRRRYEDKQFAVILEDCDAALMTRGADNREQVSAILNLTDGMLADFLRLQVLCTINGRAADIDQALLRPGRLICHRVFGRLDRAHAERLATLLGRELPVAADYSLAEIFADPEACDAHRPRIGFAV
jgi:SpoVK/Ycf46/Vps4 family AAA+-type ATPase